MTPHQIYYLTFKKYLGKDTIESFCSNSNLRNPRGKLQKLPFEQFNDLTTDVYDELTRRSDGNYNLPHLPQTTSFPEKRNLARQKLGTLPDKRFRDLATDLFIDLLIRYPDLDPELRSKIRDLPQTSTRPLPPQTPPSPIRMSLYDVNGGMVDGADRKSNGYYNDANNAERMMSQRSTVERVSKRYEAELAQAYRTNQELEMKLLSRNSNYSNNGVNTSSMNMGPSTRQDYELLKEDYHRLRQEYERTKLQLKDIQNSNKDLTFQNNEVRQSLSLYEAQGSLSLASQFAALQREHAGIKHEYQVEMEDLRRKYSALEQAQDQHLDIIETISKNNEILEFKLRQVNQALESSQQDSIIYLRQGGTISPQEPSGGYLIPDQLTKQLKSATESLLTSIREDNGVTSQTLPLQPIVQVHKQISTIVSHFLREIQLSTSSPSVSRNSIRKSADPQLEIRRLDDDFNSALANLLTLSKQYNPNSNLISRFEQEIEELNLSAEDLQLILQTNFCALPYFAVPSSIKNNLVKLTQTSRSLANRNNDDDPQLFPLREYLEEQANLLIARFGSVMSLLKRDDFSTNLTDSLTDVVNTVKTVLSETKQYKHVSHLNNNPRLDPTLERLDSCLKDLDDLLIELDQIIGKKNEGDLNAAEVEKMKPMLKKFKIDLAKAGFSLAKETKLLVKVVS